MNNGRFNDGRRLGGTKRRLSVAFTLVELLVVIAIIGILAGLLLPVLSGSSRKVKEGIAKTEMRDLVTAISKYESTYSRFPYTLDAADTQKDGTFGFTGTGTAGSKVFPANSDIMIVLLGVNAGVNLNHARNPQQGIFLTAKMVSTTDRPGVSIVDYQFRDPWGNPYVISMDMNFDGKCRDAHYSKRSVSRNPAAGAIGYHGLHNPVNASGDSDDFELAGEVMIWSLGIDGKYDDNPANTGANKDNVLGWQ